MADNVTKVDIVEIDTSQSVRSIADLKKEIKDLKGQLLSLNEGTEEYNATLTKLGDDMHQLKEIQEKASMTNQDLGTNISNATKAMSGMAGAVGAVTSALSLMGVQVGDDNKLMKTLLQLMSISQGLSAFDAGVKAVKALGMSIKAATAQQKAFNIVALKNPYLLLGAAIVAAIVAITVALKNQREEEERRHQEAMANLKTEQDARENNLKQYQKSVDEFYVNWRSKTKAQQDERKAALEQEIKDTKELLGYYNKNYAAQKEQYDQIERTEKLALYYQQRFAETGDEFFLNASESTKAFAEQLAKTYAEMPSYQSYIKGLEDYNAQLNKQKSELEAINKLQKEGIHSQEESAKTLTDTQKKVYTEYEKQLNAIKLLEAAGEDKLTVAKMNLQVETEYLGTLQKGTREYDTQLTKVAGLHTQIADMTNQEKEKTKQLQQQNIELEKQNKDRENSLKDIERQIDLVKTSMGMAEGDDKSYDGIKAQAEQEMAYNKLVYDNKVATLTDAYNAEQDYYNNLLDLYSGDADKQDEIRQQMALSQAQYNLDMLNAEKDLADQETEVNKKKNEQKKALDQQYANFAIAMTSQLSGLISAFADAQEDGAKEQKNLQVAAAIINTLAGAAGAFMQGVAAYPPPYGEILGAAGAATALATGFAQVSKMKSTKVSKSSSANVSNVTVQSIATPTSNVRQLEPQYTDEGQIEEVVTTSSEQRVVLVYSDLEAADSQRVSVDSSNAM